jgi:hypothetical protein
LVSIFRTISLFLVCAVWLATSSVWHLSLSLTDKWDGANKFFISASFKGIATNILYCPSSYKKNDFHKLETN